MDHHQHHHAAAGDQQDQEGLFQSYPCAYYVQSPSTVYSSHADVRNSTAALESAFHSPVRHDTNPIILRHDYSSSRGSNHYFNLHQKKISYDARSHETDMNNVELNRLIIVDTTSTNLDDHDNHDDDEDDDDDDDDDKDDEYYYEGKMSSSRGWWKRNCSYGNSDSSVWICLQISWRFLVSLSVALLVFYIASRPPPPKVSIQMGRIGEFVLGEGVDASGVTTKILTCNCSLNLIIDNKSKLFGLHIHPPIMQMSFQHLTFALSYGPKLYAESGSSTFPLYIGTRNKPLYGAGRDMEDMLESAQAGMPLMISVKLSSTFRVVMNFIKPKYHHHLHCLLLLHRDYDKSHRTQLFNSTCTVT